MTYNFENSKRPLKVVVVNIDSIEAFPSIPAIQILFTSGNKHNVDFENEQLLGKDWEGLNLELDEYHEKISQITKFTKAFTTPMSELNHESFQEKLARKKFLLQVPEDNENIDYDKEPKLYISLHHGLDVSSYDIVNERKYATRFDQEAAEAFQTFHPEQIVKVFQVVNKLVD